MKLAAALAAFLLTLGALAIIGFVGIASSTVGGTQGNRLLLMWGLLFLIVLIGGLGLAAWLAIGFFRGG